jgi:hypothetical protein
MNGSIRTLLAAAALLSLSACTVVPAHVSYHEPRVAVVTVRPAPYYAPAPAYVPVPVYAPKSYRPHRPRYWD